MLLSSFHLLFCFKQLGINKIHFTLIFCQYSTTFVYRSLDLTVSANCWSLACNVNVVADYITLWMLNVWQIR